jgi:hypothetical protein
MLILFAYSKDTEIDEGDDGAFPLVVAEAELDWALSP